MANTGSSEALRKGHDRRILDRVDRGRRAHEVGYSESLFPSDEASDLAPEDRRPWLYSVISGCLLAVLLAAAMAANYFINPLVYVWSAKTEVAQTFVSGKNFAVFDLNVDIRGIRRAHISRLTDTPEVIVLGASHWQEAPADLFPGKSYYNAHVHRDYYEDLLAAVEVLIENDRLPDTLIMSIRDHTFLPIDLRTDSLWLNFVPDYRAMARRLDIPSHSWRETFPADSWLDLSSLAALRSKVIEWVKAPQKPGPTQATLLDTLDILRRDGSIRWSRQHQALFTPERTREEALLAADHKIAQGIVIGDAAVEAVDRLLALLKEKGVRVVLIHPPFNPTYYDAVAGSEYANGLQRVAAETARLAAAHGAIVVGSFDPAGAGCRESMYIDSEHSNSECLKLVVDQIPGL